MLGNLAIRQAISKREEDAGQQRIMRTTRTAPGARTRSARLASVKCDRVSHAIRNNTIILHCYSPLVLLD